MSRDLEYSPPFREVTIVNGINVRHNGTLLVSSATDLNFLDPIKINISGTEATISTDSVIVDDLGNRTNAADSAGSLFFALDEGYWSYSDGATWTALLTDLTNGITGILSLTNGGTGATTSAGARTNLGLGTAATHDATDFDAAGSAATAQSNAEAYADAGDATTLSSAESYAAAGDATTLATAETYADTKLAKSANLSDVASVSTSRTNLGLGSAALHATGDFLQTANNLSDLASAATARTNLGLGTIAVVNSPIPIANGGTGQTTQQAAINALTGSQTNLKVLASDGVNASLTTLDHTYVSDFDTQVRTSRPDQLAALGASFDFNSHKGINALDPTSPQDIATMGWVLAQLAALDSKPEVAYAATSALPSNTYANGASGVGATITSTTNGPLVIDGVTTVIGAQGVGILVAADGLKNGWYTLTQQGIVAVQPWILTRRTESDQSGEMGSGYITGVAAPTGLTGGANNGKVYISLAPAPFTVGTDTVSFSEVGSTYAAGTGLTLSGNTFSIDTAITVDKTTVQTLSNKTLTAPVINSPTGIVKGDVGLGNVVNALQLQAANNLSDVVSAPSSRYNIHDQVLAACQIVITTNVASKSGIPTSDGVTVTSGNNVLLVGQTSAAENGPWQVSSGTWVRPDDYPAAGQVISRIVEVNSGSNYGGSLWLCTNPSAVLIDTTATTWIQSGSTSLETLANKTLTTPTIGSFTNAQHNHTNAAGGGQLTDAALSAAVGITKGGTGATTASSARTNLGLGTAATHADTDFAQTANNLSDLASASSARTNLGLGTSAVKDIPSSGNASSAQVVFGTDTRLTDSRTPSGSASGDLTGTYPGPTVAAGAITLAKMANLAANSIMGNNTGSPATPIALSTAQAKTLLDIEHPLTWIIDGQGNVLTTGAQKLYLSVPSAMTIVKWRILALDGLTGSIQFDIWKDTYANHPPTVADTITASAKPLISSSTKAESSTLTGWTTTFVAGDTVEINIDSVSTFTKVKLELFVKYS